MPKVRDVTNMELDEVSLVDRPANQHAAILITKRADEEETAVPDGQVDFEEVGVDDLEVGDVLLDENDNPVTVTDELLAELYADAGVPAGDELVGVGKSLADEVAYSLSKALDDSDRDEIIKGIAAENDLLRQQLAETQAIAKAEQDLRLEAEYTDRAAQYGLPVDPAELGPVMKRAAERLDYEDCVILNKVFEAAGEAASMAFDEIGKQGMGANADPFGIVEALIDVSDGSLSKADDGTQLSQAATIAKAFAQNPEAYDEYERQQAAARRGF